MFYKLQLFIIADINWFSRKESNKSINQLFYMSGTLTIFSFNQIQIYIDR